MKGATWPAFAQWSLRRRIMSELALEGVSIRYGRGVKAHIAVDDVRFRVESGRTLGIVGESGSGKSSLARAMVGLAPISSGRILLDGQDLTSQRQSGRPFPIQLVFQNSMAALNPRATASASIAEALTGRGVAKCEVSAMGDHYLDLVGLDAARGSQLPNQLSGGQRQRVAIARALAAEPKVLVADEITSALDVSVQAAILNLVMRLQAQLRFTLVFISHNLAAVRYLSDSIVVMHRGRVVESGPTNILTAAPQQAYTRDLLDAVPRLRREGDAPHP
jgi:peptide/nickel transport system ATP-binding protein